MEEVRAMPGPTLCAKVLGGREDMDLEELCRERGIAVDGGLICKEHNQQLPRKRSLPTLEYACKLLITDFGLIAQLNGSAESFQVVVFYQEEIIGIQDLLLVVRRRIVNPWATMVQ
jgi:hypothetical protein